MPIIEKINGWHPVVLSLFAFAFSFTSVEQILKICVLTVALGYSIWKWWFDIKNKKDKK